MRQLQGSDVDGCPDLHHCIFPSIRGLKKRAAISLALAVREQFAGALQRRKAAWCCFTCRVHQDGGGRIDHIGFLVVMKVDATPRSGRSRDLGGEFAIGVTRAVQHLGQPLDVADFRNHSIADETLAHQAHVVGHPAGYELP